MKRRLLGSVAILLVLAACEPGFPDSTYGDESVAVVPTDMAGISLAPDGGVVGLWNSRSSTRLYRLDPTGTQDTRWSAPLVAGNHRIEAALDGGAIVITAGDPDFRQVTVRRVAADGTLSTWVADLPNSFVIAVRDLGTSIRIVALTQIAPSDTEPAAQLAIVDIFADGAVLYSDIDTSSTLLTTDARFEALIDPDGSVLLVDQLAGVDATAASAPYRLRRFGPSGAIDPAFGGDGDALASELTAPCADGAYPMLGMGGGSSVGPWLVLKCVDGDSELVRLTPLGVVDTAFSGGALTGAEVVTGAPVGGFAFGRFFPQSDGSVFATIVTCQVGPRTDCVGFPSMVVRFDAQGLRDVRWGFVGFGLPTIDAVRDIRAASTGVMLVGSVESPTGVVGTAIERLVAPLPAE